MRKLIVRLVLLSRWAMVPLFVGLIAGLVLLVVAFALQLWQFAVALPSLTDTQVIMALLTLIDLALVGGLLVIVISSGYENFVEKIEQDDATGWPDWMTRITFSGLKLKLFASLMAITSITLLKAMMRLETSVSETQVKWLVVANMVFIAGYAVLALTDRFTRGGEQG
ncbi:YqhA family protein [Aquabacter sp. L1I39]|uniref:YqhA family protein n=1 Tax=Aquabacter sp. L1I39 TaxID=2820278 RepID=UPI001ADC608C|nr:YqhA family protein [Aquabacter sp. L1I39]QTL04969.1 YqhA family protein [Aquabacter sp. L1I39]